MRRLMQRFLAEETGLELSEYAVMAALIVAMLITAIVALREAIRGKFIFLKEQITNPDAAGGGGATP